MKRTVLTLATLAAGWLTSSILVAQLHADGAPGQQAQSPAARAQTARPVGAVKAVSGKTITLTTDAGAVVTVLVQDSTRVVRVEPGQRDLKGATPIQFQDLQVTDRILVLGKTSVDANSIVASSIIVMKHSDVEARQQHEREDWQKRGVGGLVSAVDSGAGTIAISTSTFGANKNVAIHVLKGTILRRYAPDSVKFDDARPGTLGQIKPGDQVRARGARSTDGSELTAEEIVSGSFRNIAGTVASIDPAANTVSVMDLATKKPVLIKLTGESQLRKLPPPVAQRIAMRLKGAPEEGAPGAAEKVSVGADSRAGTRPERTEQRAGGAGGMSRPGGPPDFQQMLSRMPAVTLADLQKGDALMVVSTQGSAPGEVTAITMLAGVEPILEASPKDQAMILSPWSLGSPSGDVATP
jgi:hypothetical protein